MRLWNIAKANPNQRQEFVAQPGGRVPECAKSLEQNANCDHSFVQPGDRFLEFCVSAEYNLNRVLPVHPSRSILVFEMIQIHAAHSIHLSRPPEGSLGSRPTKMKIGDQGNQLVIEIDGYSVEIGAKSGPPVAGNGGTTSGSGS